MRSYFRNLNENLTQAWIRNKGWLGRDILLPFAATRLALLLAGWYSQVFPFNSRYSVEGVLARGWQFSPNRLLDIWGRWDSGWYMKIIFEGYRITGDIETTQSNIAFFPLYPFLVKLFMQLVPDGRWSMELALLVGVIFSNLFLLGALILLYRLSLQLLGGAASARRTILYLLVFPTSFFLSAFYTEAAFLFFSVAAFYFAWRGAWVLAAIAGYLLALTRPLGVLILIPLLWLYLEGLGWKLPRIRRDIAWLLLIPVGFLTFMLYIYTITGDFWAPVRAQQGWQKSLAFPLVSLFESARVQPFTTPIDRYLTILFAGLSFLTFFRFASKTLAIHSFLLLLPPLMGGTLLSMSRYCLVAFPAFMVLAWLGKRPLVHQLTLFLFFALQILLMAAWAQFYWVA